MSDEVKQGASAPMLSLAMEMLEEGEAQASDARRNRRDALRDQREAVGRRHALALAALDRVDSALDEESFWVKAGTIGGAVFGVLTQSGSILSGDPISMVSGAGLLAKDLYLGGVEFGENLGKFDSKNHRLAAADLRAESARADVSLDQAKMVQSDAEQMVRGHEISIREAEELERAVADLRRGREVRSGQARMQAHQRDELATARSRIREQRGVIREARRRQVEARHRAISHQLYAERKRIRSAAYRAGLKAVDRFNQISGVAMSYLTAGATVAIAGAVSAGLQVASAEMIDPLDHDAARADRTKAEDEMMASRLEARAKKASERVDEQLDRLTEVAKDVRRQEGRA